MSQPAPAKAAAKAEAKPRQAFSAFGVTVDPVAKSSAEKLPMTPRRKALIWLAAGVPVIGLVLWYQYGSHNDVDADANADVREVVKLEQKKDAAGLAQLVRSDDSAVARRAVVALGNLQGPSGLDSALSDRRADVRLTAVTQLASSGDAAPIPVLARYLKDPEPDIRITAMRGIANSRDFTMFDHLIPMLNDPQASVRRGALSAIESRIGLKFDDFDPNGSAESRAAAIARMRALLPKFRQRFELANDFERNRQRGR